MDNVNVRYGSETVLDTITCCVHAGEFIGLVGPNGAGKTTFLRVLLGLLRPNSGTVHRERAVLGYVPQRGALYQGMVPISVLEVVQLGSNGNHSQALAALAKVHMDGFAGKRFTELSGGQQQRISIAKALAGNASMLILDEPATGIDEQSQEEFYTLLQQLHSGGTTILMVSHEVDTVLKMVTRVLCLNRTILYDGPPEHFEADAYLPQAYTKYHMQLHHQHGGTHA